MIVKHKYNGKEYTLSNENLQNGDKVYPISRGKSNSEKFTYEHWSFEWRYFMTGWISEPHTILDIHYSDYKPYEVHTSHGFSPIECYFKIISVEPILKLQPPTDTAEAITKEVKKFLMKLNQK